MEKLHEGHRQLRSLFFPLKSCRGERPSEREKREREREERVEGFETSELTNALSTKDERRTRRRGKKTSEGKRVRTDLALRASTDVAYRASFANVTHPPRFFFLFKMFAGKKENENMPAAKKVAGPAHPPYEKMVKAALVALKDRTGSSTQAIAKYMKANYDLPENFAKSLSRFLKKFVESGKLVKVKASYKLGSLKTEPKPKKKKVRAEFEWKKSSLHALEVSLRVFCTHP